MGSEDQTRSKLCSNSPKDLGRGPKAATCLSRWSKRCSILLDSGDQASHPFLSKPRPSTIIAWCCSSWSAWNMSSGHRCFGLILIPETVDHTTKHIKTSSSISP
ncbi:hypothetical protein TNCV_1542191 [Trichonephila clavipes]|nr:hypothetical protein TNCV_1542191 [Trichonephila clavipes]